MRKWVEMEKKMRKKKRRLFRLLADNFYISVEIDNLKLLVVSADKLGIVWQYDTKTDNLISIG